MLLSKKSKLFKTVHSSSARTCIVRDRTVYKFTKNSDKNGDKRSLDNDTHLKTTVGNVITCCAPCSAQITGLTYQWNGDYTSFDLTWSASEGTIYYTVHFTKGDNTYVLPTITYPYGNDLTARVFYNSTVGSSTTDDTFTVFAHKQLCSVSASINTLPCFLEGSLVHMADGTTRAIEDVLVHDKVVGAFGEINEVLFLHRPRLGSARMCCINNDHHTTNHHPHVSVDKQFYCGDPEAVSASTYGRSHAVLDEQGNEVEQMLYGLAKERIHTLQLGVELKTIEGSQVVQTMEVYSMPEDTQLYNLVVSGSHTYHVDGYAVTGWPREDDFDYDEWNPIFV